MVKCLQSKCKTFLLLGVLAIVSCKTVKNSETLKFDFSYQKKWEYITLKDTIKIKVIEHIPAEVLCGYIATASITIGKTDENDTIRIINLCNMNILEKDKMVEFVISKKPNFVVSLPLSKNISKDRVSNKLEFQPSFFDRNILKTTYGYFIKN